MRREEEIVDACIAVGAFVMLCVIYICISTSCCIRMMDWFCCRTVTRVRSYNNLEELLFDVNDNTVGGRLTCGGDDVDNNSRDDDDDDDGEVHEITVCNFFCNVLEQKSQRRQRRPITERQQQDGDDDDDQGNSRFSEPLL